MFRFRTTIKTSLNFLYSLFSYIRFHVRSCTPNTVEAMIRKAIKEKRLLSFYYDGKHRVVELHIYGIKNRDEGMLCYQIRGESSSGGLPNWRRMKLKGITNLTVLDEIFTGKRPVTGMHSSWDVIYLIVS